MYKIKNERHANSITENNSVKLDDLYKVLDHDYLINNAHWSGGNDDYITLFYSDTPHKFVHSKFETAWKENYDSPSQFINPLKITEFESDAVIVYSCHSFSGTSFDYIFLLNGIECNIDSHIPKFAKDKKSMKELLISEANRHMEFISRQVLQIETLVENIQKIHSL